MRSKFVIPLILSVLLLLVSIGNAAMAFDDLEDFGGGADDVDVVASEGIFDRVRAPAAYRSKVVRSGELRTSEFFHTTELVGNTTVNTLAVTKASHAGRFVGVKVSCVSDVNALCQLPALAKNGTPITDALVLRGKQTLLIPFNEIVPVDTSDTIDVSGSVTISGAGDEQVSRVMYELYTPRNFVPTLNGGN